MASLPAVLSPLCEHSAMPEVPSTAVLSSIEATLDDLRSRLAEAAEAFAQAGEESRAGELYEVERHLLRATRRMTRVMRP